MNGRIGRVLKLLRNPGVRSFLRQRFGLGDGAFHPLGARRQNELRAEHRQQGAAFERHRFGHGENDFVALGRGDERERNAGVTAGRLDDDGVFRQDAALLGVFNHRHADAILNAAERVEKFALEQNGGVQPGGDFVEFDERGAAHGFDDVVVDTAHKFSPVILLFNFW